MFEGTMTRFGQRVTGLFLSADGIRLYYGNWLEDEPIALDNPMKGVTWFLILSSLYNSKRKKETTESEVKLTFLSLLSILYLLLSFAALDTSPLHMQSNLIVTPDEKESCNDTQPVNDMHTTKTNCDANNVQDVILNVSECEKTNNYRNQVFELLLWRGANRQDRID